MHGARRNVHDNGGDDDDDQPLQFIDVERIDA